MPRGEEATSATLDFSTSLFGQKRKKETKTAYGYHDYERPRGVGSPHTFIRSCELSLIPFFTTSKKKKKKSFQADIDFDKSPASHPGGREEDAADGHLI